MKDEKVEELWFALWLIKAIVSLLFLWAVALLCKWGLRRIRSKSAKRRPLKQSTVHSLGTVKSLRKFNASEFKVVDRSSSERKKRIG